MCYNCSSEKRSLRYLIMIVVKLQGGLGNQMFQWAFGKHLSNKYNVPLYLDTNFYNQNTSSTKRNFTLNKFNNLKYQLFNSDVKSNGKQFLRFSEPPNFTNLPYDSNYNWYLDGYFQSEKYFIESSDLIRSELNPDSHTLKKILHIIPSDKNTISLHIRRTDYISSNGYHPVQPIEYYKKAINVIGEYDCIFVFSDDIQWCKQNLQFNNIVFVEGLSDIEDMWAMSMCKSNIIANSSFSWWGAWLNNEKDKKVIYPIKWFGSQANLNTGDMIPKNWKCLE